MWREFEIGFICIIISFLVSSGIVSYCLCNLIHANRASEINERI